MSKYKSIKKNNVVYIRKAVMFDGKEYDSFFIPVKVQRVARTQFAIEGGERFYKLDGKSFGDPSRFAYLENAKTKYGIACNETEKLKDLKLRLRLEAEIKVKLLHLEKRLTYNSKISSSKLDLVIKILEETANIIESKPFHVSKAK